MVIILSPNMISLRFSGMLLDDVFVALTVDFRKIDYVVSAQLTFWFLLNVLVILYPMYMIELCDLSSTIRSAN